MANEPAEELIINYTADFHGCFEALSRCSASFARGGNCICLDGGDTLQGSPAAYWLGKVWEGSGSSIPAEIMNACGYDFVTLGNHEFSFGEDTLVAYLKGLHAQCLCANATGISGTAKYALKVMPNGLRIGITGLCTPFDRTHFTDAFEAAKEVTAKLDEYLPDVKICIYHGGFELPPEIYDPETDSLPEKPMAENQGLRIARDLNFDILLTAHQHIAFAGKDICGTFVCQVPDNGCAFLRIIRSPDRKITSELTFPEEKKNEAVSGILNRITPELEAWLDTKVGGLDRELIPEDRLKMAAEGSLIANLFNQIQQEASGADVSCTALGNEVFGLEKTVTVRDILRAYGYPNTLKTIRIKGKILKKALERSAEYFSTDSSGNLSVSEEFLSPMVQHFNYDYFSGIEYVMDPTREKGNRVVSVRYEGKELADDRELILALNDYRASGMGGYGFYAECPVISESTAGISELIIDYFRKYGCVTVDGKKYITLLRT